MKIAFIYPGDLETPTGGYQYDRAILAEWEKTGIAVERVSIEGSFPFPSLVEKSAALEQIKAISGCDAAIVDGLAGGCMPEFMKTIAELMPVIALVHHPLCLETGLSEGDAEALETLESDGLDHVSAIVTTSNQTAKTVRDLFGFQANDIDCVEPGVQRGEISAPSEIGSKRLLCVASLTPRKAHGDLLNALGNLAGLDWTLDCVGPEDLDKPHAASIREQLVASSISERVVFHGTANPQALDGFYKNADIFVLPSLYEGYGMVYAEAIVRGIPVIGCNVGAVPDTVPAGCGMLVEPGNPTELAAAIETLITEDELRSIFRRNCLLEAENFPYWEESAEKFAGIVRRLL